MRDGTGAVATAPPPPERPARPRPPAGPVPVTGAALAAAPAPGGGRDVPVRRFFWPLLRTVGGVAVLGLLLWRLGTGPFLDGLRLIDGSAIAAALGIGALTTVCCAWRWSLVAGGLGVHLPLRAAVAHYYRSVFLNATLPGGVVGDVHRAVRHGRDAGDVGRGIRAVVWERTAGQVVQVGIAVVVLAVFPSPVRPHLPLLLALSGVAVGIVLLVRLLPKPRPAARSTRDPGAPHRRPPVGSDRSGWTPPGTGRSRCARALGTARADVRDGLLARRAWAGVLLASTVVVAGQLATFLVAARTVGATAPLALLVPLTLLALLAMGLPTNIGGFGPREGAAAWAFGAAGLTAAQGVATAMVYGALVLVASLPGAAVLVSRRVSRPAAVHREEPALVHREEPALVHREDTVGG